MLPLRALPKLHVFAISVIGFNRVKGSAGKSFWKSAFQRSDTFQETSDALMSSDNSSEARNEDYLFGWRASSSPHFFFFGKVSADKADKASTEYSSTDSWL